MVSPPGAGVAGKVPSGKVSPPAPGAGISGKSLPSASTGAGFPGFDGGASCLMVLAVVARST